MIQEIREEAIFIADSHYPHHGQEFLDILQRIERGEIQTPQLFLMGDNFDLLCGYANNAYLEEFSKDAIIILQQLSQKLEIHYIEGNHDFLLSSIFPNINVYSRDAQPIIFKLNNQKVALSHGDKYAIDWMYNLYAKVSRDKLVIKLLKPLEKFIVDYLMKKLSKKKICHSFDGFEKRVAKIMRYYKGIDIVIEGHFHQAKTIDNYISLPSLACQKEVGVIENSKMVFKKL
ncbi:MAG: metallophosphoesterase [Sulfurovum sp.]